MSKYIVQSKSYTVEGQTHTHEIEQEEQALEG